jgi:Domain of unknown function (DUF3883)
VNLVAYTQTLAAELIAEHASAPNLFGEIAHIESMLAETYHDRVQYELLQNSDDAAARTVRLTTAHAGEFTWENDGRVMTEQDVSALCRSATSVKRRGTDIGYRGIGFKCLAAIADRVSVSSGRVSFDFDRVQAAALLDSSDLTRVPVIRIPTNVRPGQFDGARFRVHLAGSTPDLHIDPTAMLFLRNVEQVDADGPGLASLRARRAPGRVSVWDASGEAQFALLESDGASVAVPLSAPARAMTGPTGRLACFLPLDESVGLPVIVSGDVSTDPSRTHAVIDDPSTTTVLEAAAAALADVLSSPGHDLFTVAWDLLLAAPDPRGTLLGTARTATSAFLTALRDRLSRITLPFALTPVELTETEAAALFPEGTPPALYTSENKSAARALKAALGLPAWDVTQLAQRARPERLSPATRARVAQLLADNARVHARPLTPAEEAFGPSGASSLAQDSRVTPARDLVPPPLGPVQVSHKAKQGDASLPEVMNRWRVAEVAVVEWLNGKGWQLTDVSKQNLGYDAEGTDPHGRRICLEIKKVDRPDTPFSMTTNEWALVQSRAEPMMLAIVVGDGRSSRLALFDPLAAGITPIRVARQWEWRFENWAAHTTWAE